MATCLRLPMVYKPHPFIRPPSLRRRPSFITNSILPPKRSSSSISSSSSSSSSRKPKPRAHLMPDGMIEDDLFQPRIVNFAEEEVEADEVDEMEDAGPHRDYSRRSRDPDPPPNVESMYLDERIVFIGEPFVPEVTELIVAELLHLYDVNPYKPVSLYIDSTGTVGEEGELCAMDSEGFAIYDALMQFRGTTTIRTMALGEAVGHACLLLAAGTKGKRYMYPRASVTIHPPVSPPSGLMSAIDAISSADEVRYNRDLFTKLFALHTGNTVEAVAEKMKGTYCMDAREAKKFGVIDHVMWYNNEDLMKSLLPPEEYPKPELKKKKKRVFNPVYDY